jgi:hypothetical protein
MNIMKIGIFKQYKYTEVAPNSRDKKDNCTQAASGSLFKQPKQSDLASVNSLPLLPPEILQKIAFELEFADLLSCSLVNRQFHQLIAVAGLDYFQCLFRGLNTGDIETIAAAEAVKKHHYAWLGECIPRLIKMENTADIENVAAEETGKTDFYAWLRKSPPGLIRVKFLNYLYLLERPNRFSIDSFDEKNYKAKISYNLDGFMSWLKKNNFSLIPTEVNSLERMWGWGKLDVDLAKLKEDSSFSSNKILKSAIEGNRISKWQLRKLAVTLGCALFLWITVCIVYASWFNEFMIKPKIQ